MEDLAIWIALGAVFISLIPVSLGVAVARKNAKKKEPGDDAP